MPNRGVAPFAPATEVGQFRVLYPDVVYTDLDPVEAGYGDYEYLSDDEITALVTAAGSVYRALGVYFIQLAGQAAKASQSVKDHDLAIDSTKRAADLRAQAKEWFDLADEQDAGSEDAFDIVEFDRCGSVIPEATIAQYGRVYTWDRIC